MDAYKAFWLKIPPTPYLVARYMQWKPKDDISNKPPPAPPPDIEE